MPTNSKKSNPTVLQNRAQVDETQFESFIDGVLPDHAESKLAYTPRQHVTVALGDSLLEFNDLYLKLAK